MGIFEGEEKSCWRGMPGFKYFLASSNEVSFSNGVIIALLRVTFALLALVVRFNDGEKWPGRWKLM